MDNRVPIIVFNIKRTGNIRRVIAGRKDRFTGSLIREGSIWRSKEEIAQIRNRMEKAIEDIRKELATIRTGRASISILDNIQVEYYGIPTPINQVAQLATPDPTLITVQPYDVSLVGPIEKVDPRVRLGLNPSNDGRLIRIPIPSLTEDRRKQLANTSTRFSKITARLYVTFAATATIT